MEAKIKFKIGDKVKIIPEYRDQLISWYHPSNNDPVPTKGIIESIGENGYVMNDNGPSVKIGKWWFSLTGLEFENSVYHDLDLKNKLSQVVDCSLSEGYITEEEYEYLNKKLDELFIEER